MMMKLFNKIKKKKTRARTCLSLTHTFYLIFFVVVFNNCTLVDIKEEQKGGEEEIIKMLYTIIVKIVW